MRSPHSYLEVEGQKMRPVSFRPNFLNLPYEHILECVFFAPEGS